MLSRAATITDVIVEYCQTSLGQTQAEMRKSYILLGLFFCLLVWFGVFWPVEPSYTAARIN